MEPHPHDIPISDAALARSIISAARDGSLGVTRARARETGELFTLLALEIKGHGVDRIVPVALLFDGPDALTMLEPITTSDPFIAPADWPDHLLAQAKAADPGNAQP
jgi:hypothetical protein